MAKSKSYFTLRRGSTKSHTFQVVRGKQITKDRVEAPSNPRTLRQQAQRMYMATASAAYAAMRAIVNHSFEGVAYNSPSMAVFCRLNAIAIRENGIQGANFAMNPYQDRALRPGAYIMSDGSLTEIDPAKVALPNDAGPSGGDNTAMFGIKMTSPTTNKLLALTGGKVGDMITCCKIQDVTAAGDFEFSFVRLIILTADDDALTTANLASKVTVESNIVGTPKVDNGIVGIELSDASSLEEEGCVCAIASSLDGYEWKRSFAQMKVVGSFIDAAQNQDAFNTYPLGVARVLNGEGI